MPLKMTLGLRLRQLRLAKKLTLRELAKRITKHTGEGELKDSYFYNYDYLENIESDEAFFIYPEFVDYVCQELKCDEKEVDVIRGLAKEFNCGDINFDTYIRAGTRGGKVASRKQRRDENLIKLLEKT